MARKKSKKKASSKKLPKDSLVIKTGEGGIRLTGAYRIVIPAEVIDKLKSRSKEVIIKEEYLDYLVPSSYSKVNSPEILKTKTEPEKVPNPEDDSAKKSEDK